MKNIDFNFVTRAPTFLPFRCVIRVYALIRNDINYNNKIRAGAVHGKKEIISPGLLKTVLVAPSRAPKRQPDVLSLITVIPERV